MQIDQPVILVSGGTGIVGAPLVELLRSEWPDHEVVILTRGGGADITRPDLGLSEEQRARLRPRTRVIVHCAANTRFNLSIEESRLANTHATRHMLDFAAQCPSLQQFAHIGTLYIAGRRPGTVTEQPLRHTHGYVNTYEQSKHEAEEMVLAEKRFPVGIYRLSSVVDEHGDSGHFRQVIRFFPWADQFRFFPADPAVTVDLVSAAWTAEALAVLIARCFEPGCIRHVCAGLHGALSVQHIFDRVFRDSSSRPAFLPLGRFERLARSAASRALDPLMTYLPHLSIQQPFDAINTHRLLAQHGVSPCDSASLLDRVLTRELKTSHAV